MKELNPLTYLVPLLYVDAAHQETAYNEGTGEIREDIIGEIELEKYMDSVYKNIELFSIWRETRKEDDKQNYTKALQLLRMLSFPHSLILIS